MLARDGRPRPARAGARGRGACRGLLACGAASEGGGGGAGPSAGDLVAALEGGDPSAQALLLFEPKATDDEVRASALQFVRKISGLNGPSRANEAVFAHAVDAVTRAARDLLDSLVTTAPPRDREVEATKARARAAQRFGVRS